MTLKLTRAQRTKLGNLEAPTIAGTGEPPISKGHVHRLSPKLDLEVLRVNVSVDARGKRWWLDYKVVDRRDSPRLLRRTPPVTHHSRSEFDEYGYPLPQEASETSDASSYTAGGSSVVADAGEAVPRSVQDGFTERAKLEGHQANVARRLSFEQQHIVRRLATHLLEAERLGISPGRAQARVEAAVAKLERDVSRAKQQRRAA